MESLGAISAVALCLSAVEFSFFKTLVIFYFFFCSRAEIKYLGRGVVAWPSVKLKATSVWRMFMFLQRSVVGCVCRFWNS